jgi:hypothetical protein
MESQPRIATYSRDIVDDQGQSQVHLTIIEYDNAIQASLYDKNPKLGSMILAYTVGDLVEQLVLFQGKHEQYARALAMMLARQTKTIIYASVNLSEYAKISNETIRELIADHLESKS